MTHREIINRVMVAKAVSYHCSPVDFTLEKNKVSIAKSDEPFFRMISFGRNTVVSVNEEFYGWCRSWFDNVEGIFCFDAPQLVEIGMAMQSFGYSVGEIFDCLLPSYDIRNKVAKVPSVDFDLFENEEVIDLYSQGKFENALSPDRPAATTSAFVAFEEGKLCGVAGASRNGDEYMWVGVDVLPHARNKGIASRLMFLLTQCLLERGEITMYSTWYSNIASRKVALMAGYLPAWVEISSEPRKCNNAPQLTETSSTE